MIDGIPVYAKTNTAHRFNAPFAVFDIETCGRPRLNIVPLEATRAVLREQLSQLEYLISLREELEADPDITSAQIRAFTDMRTQLETRLSNIWRTRITSIGELSPDGLMAANIISGAALIVVFRRLRRFTTKSALVGRLHDELQGMLLDVTSRVGNLEKGDLVGLQWSGLVLVNACPDHKEAAAARIRSCVQAIVAELGDTWLDRVLDFEGEYPRLHLHLRPAVTDVGD